MMSINTRFAGVTMFRFTFAAFAALVVAAANGNPARADIVGVDFNCLEYFNTATYSGQGAISLAGNVWNGVEGKIPYGPVTVNNLLDSTGMATGINLSIPLVSGAYSLSANAAATNPQSLLQDYLYANGQVGVSSIDLTLSGLAANTRFQPGDLRWPNLRRRHLYAGSCQRRGHSIA